MHFPDSDMLTPIPSELEDLIAKAYHEFTDNLPEEPSDFRPLAQRLSEANACLGETETSALIREIWDWFGLWLFIVERGGKLGE